MATKKSAKKAAKKAAKAQPSNKKAPVKKAQAKKAAKKSPAKKTAGKSNAKKATASPGTTKKASAKPVANKAAKKVNKKIPAAQSSAKTTTKKAAASKSKVSASKAAAKTAAQKTTAKKTTASAAKGSSQGAASKMSHLLPPPARRSERVFSTDEWQSFFSPLDDRVLIEPEKAEQVTQSGLIVPFTQANDLSRGTIVAVGRGHRDRKGRVRPLDVQVGDKVVLARYGGQQMKILDREVIIAREADILGIVD